MSECVELENLVDSGRQGNESKRWKSRTALSAVLRGVLAIFPPAVAFTITVLIGRSVNRSSWPLQARLGWILAMVFTGLAIGVVVGRVTERLLPIAALVKLNLAFPKWHPHE